MNQTRACRLTELAVTTYRYRGEGRRPELLLRESLRRHATVRRRWGYRRLLVPFRREGVTDNHKRVYRPYPSEGLQVRQRRRRKQELVRGTERPSRP